MRSWGVLVGPLLPKNGIMLEKPALHSKSQILRENQYFGGLRALGGALGPLLGALGSFLAALGPLLGALGALLGPSWALLGAVLGHLGAILRP